MASRKMNEDVAYARNTESGCNHRDFIQEIVAGDSHKYWFVVCGELLETITLLQTRNWDFPTLFTKCSFFLVYYSC